MNKWAKLNINQERHFTAEQIEQANSINIIEYARKHGYEVKKVTAQSYKIPGHGGLYIHSGGLKWNHFSADVGGGSIQFVMHMENKSWVEAVKTLLDLPSEHFRAFSSATTEKLNAKRPFRLPEKNDTCKHVLAYLIGTRKIDRQLVYDLIRQNKIFENKYYHNCVFVGYDSNGSPKYAAVRGSNSSVQYRKDVAGSDKRYPFTVTVSAGHVCVDNAAKCKHLIVFESPIDLMSYLTLMKLNNITNFNAHCISLGGVSDLALQEFLKTHPDISEITLGLDNDEAGRFACEQLTEKYGRQYAIYRHLPLGKDFNEDLVTNSLSRVGEAGCDYLTDELEELEL